jgi:hypothetical protein
LDTKKNIIMDGSFTKLLYSTDFATMNGIYMRIPLVFHNETKMNSKVVLHFSPANQANWGFYKELCRFEHDVIAAFRTYASSQKTPVYAMREYFKFGTVKIFRSPTHARVAHEGETESVCVLKISGIWETENSVGVTYKIVEMLRGEAP